MVRIRGYVHGYEQEIPTHRTKSFGGAPAIPPDGSQELYREVGVVDETTRSRIVRGHLRFAVRSDPDGIGPDPAERHLDSLFAIVHRPAARLWPRQRPDVPADLQHARPRQWLPACRAALRHLHRRRAQVRRHIQDHQYGRLPDQPEADVP